MKLHHIPLLTLFLCACGTAPKPVVPDGSQRVPVNSQNNIDAYLERLKQSRLAAQDETAGAQRIAALESQLRDARQLLAAWASADSLPAVAPHAPPPPTPANGSRIESRPGRVVFHFVQPAAASGFHPSAEWQTRLLPTAAASHDITIRAGTDAALSTPASGSLAGRFAMLARDSLVQHGISADYIHIDPEFVSSGGTGKQSSQARQRNAHVFLEIEVETETAPLDAARRQAVAEHPAGGVK